MKFKNFSKWQPRNLGLIQSILEEAPGGLPVELQKIDGAALLSVNKCTEGRYETLSIGLRRDWLEEPSGAAQLALAVRRFADLASGLESDPFVRVPLAIRAC